MRRTLAAIQIDLLSQARNQLYAISFAVSAIMSGLLGWLSGPNQLSGTIPMAVLFIVGGSTLLYVVAMVILEKDDGTLNALIVSPLRPVEYLSSKVLTLSAIAVMEGVVLTLGAILLMRQQSEAPWPNLWFFVGLAPLAVMHTLVGIILVVRHRRIMEALLPMGAIATLLQIPAFYFLGVVEHPAILLIPSAAPCMFLKASFVPLETWEWFYACIYTPLSLVALAQWSLLAFKRHIIHKGGA